MMFKTNFGVDLCILGRGPCFTTILITRRDLSNLPFRSAGKVPNLKVVNDPSPKVWGSVEIFVSLLTLDRKLTAKFEILINSWKKCSCVLLDFVVIKLRAKGQIQILGKLAYLPGFLAISCFRLKFLMYSIFICVANCLGNHWRPK